MPLSAMTVQFVQSALAECGVPLPADAQKAVDTLTALQTEAVRDVVAEALEAAASSPLTAKNASKRVQDLSVALIAQQRAGEAARHYEAPVLQQFRQAIVDNLDGLIVAMRPYFDQAAEVLHTAGATLEPGVAPSVHDGMGAVQTHVALGEAQQVITRVNSARVRITELAGYAEPDATWYIESAEDAEALRLARVLWKRGAHHLTRAGYRLSLNTRAEAEAVATNAANGTAAAAEASTRARIAANRDPLRDAAYAKLLGQ